MATEVFYDEFECDGIVFIFKKDSVDAGLSHIWARHMLDENDAINCWFDGTHRWNAERRRFECIDPQGEIEVFLFWLRKGEVRIITCARVRA